MITIAPTDLDRERLAAASRPAQQPPVDYRGVTVQKPWGFEHEVYRNAELSVWRLQLSAKSETSMHCHPGKTTLLFVADGEVVFSTLQERFTMRAGDALVIEKGAFHKTETLAGAVLFELESPPNKHDLVRIADRYGRQGKGYEKCASPT